MTGSLCSLFDLDRARPHRPVLTDLAGRTVTSGELTARSAQMANALVRRGVGPGDRVAVQIETSLEVAILYLAVLRAGAVFMPVSTAYTLKDLRRLIEFTRPRLLVCDPKALASLSPLSKRTGLDGLQTLADDGVGALIDEAEQCPDVFENVPRRPDDLAATLEASGAVAGSRGLDLTHFELGVTARRFAHRGGLADSDVVLHALPMFHTDGLLTVLNAALTAASHLILVGRTEIDLAFPRLSEATITVGAPIFYIRLMRDARLKRRLLQNVRLCISDRAPLQAELRRQWKRRTGRTIIEGDCIAAEGAGR